MKKNLSLNCLYKEGRSLLLLFLLFSVSMSFVSCSEESFDYDHPDVALFVKQLKQGEFEVLSEDGEPPMPKFTVEDIGQLLDYADDLSVIPSFPLAPVSYSAGGKLRLGECLLWTVETIRLGHIASMGCKMVHVGADNYEGIYFLSDEEVKDAVARYRHWWENRRYPRTVWTIDPCWNEPLCGSGYMWW